MTRAAAIVAAVLSAFVSLPPAVAETPTVPCQPGPRDPAGVYVNLNDDTNREAIAHARAAVAAGEPRVLHWDPADARARRAASLRGVRTAPGKDRDEYPPAASAEGGAGADVRLIASGDNRSAGSRMSAQMGGYCVGTRFVIEP